MCKTLVKKKENTVNDKSVLLTQLGKKNIQLVGRSKDIRYNYSGPSELRSPKGLVQIGLCSDVALLNSENTV